MTTDQAGSQTLTDVRVRFWAGARAAVGHSELTVAVPSPASVESLRERLVALHPAAAKTLGVCSVLVGDRPIGTTDPASVLVSGDETVEFLPPFAGG